MNDDEHLEGTQTAPEDISSEQQAAESSVPDAVEATSADVEPNPIMQPQSEVSQPVKPKRSLHKLHIVIAVLAFLLLAALASAGYFYMQSQNTSMSDQAASETIDSEEGKDSAVADAKEIETELKEIAFTWKTPEPVAATAGLFENLEGYYESEYGSGTDLIAQYKYYKVGTTPDGTVAYMLHAPTEGLGSDYYTFYTEQDGTIVVYQQHSSGWFYAQEDGQEPTYNGPKLGANASVEKSTVIAAIEIKEDIRYKGQKLSTSGALFGPVGFAPNGAPETPDGSVSRYEKLSDVDEGILYEWIGSEDNDYRISSFTLLLRNGLTVAYTIRGELSSQKVDPITWTDGSRNGDDYASVGRGCGIFGANEIALRIRESDLSHIGTSDNGQKVYGLKQTSSPLLKKHYDEYIAFSGDQAMMYAEGDRDLTLDQFVKRRAIYLVQDALDRWLVFSNLRYVPQGGCAKPVVYLYPETPRLVDVTVGADVTLSDPQYETNGWQNVVALPSGTLFYKWRAYDSLFWEGFGQGEYPEITHGVVVTQSEVIETWRDHLAQLNLNEKEINDFVEFWKTKIPDSPYVRISWLTTSDLQKLAPLYVSGGVDTMLRVFLDMEGLIESIDIPEQKLYGQQRNGFTVVEWGGLVEDGSVPRLQ